MIEVATLAEMCQILKIDNTTGAKHWRKWPHFFATDGRAGVTRFTAHCVLHFVATRLKDSRLHIPRNHCISRLNEPQPNREPGQNRTTD